MDPSPSKFTVSIDLKSNDWSVREEPVDVSALLKALAGLAPRMIKGKRRWWSIKQYDGLADAIWWSDEMLLWPRPNADESDALRCLAHYRTTLILGKPDETLRPFWDVAKEWFPNWIGFAPDRTTPNPRLVKYYHRMHQAFGRMADQFVDDVKSTEQSNA